MGKKGKRSKQKDARKEADKIIKEYDKLVDEGWNNQRDELFSKAANQYRDAIRLLESKKELMMYTRDEQRQACVYLMQLEYQRWNYKAALDCCNYYMARYRHISTHFRGYVILHQQLIMFRLSGQECQVSDFVQFISRREGRNVEAIYREALVTFRAHKMYDSAIRLEMTCGSLFWSQYESKLSLALTYLEQYRLDFHKRSKMRRKDFSRMNSLITSLQVESPIEEGGYDEHYLVLAQWIYLTHTLAADKSAEEESIIGVKSMLKEFLYSKVVVSEEGSLKMKQDCCYTCGQTATSTEVQYVCSGRRVACYCSINHQRMTWKKEAQRGMRIGHEILCPLYNVFRKYRKYILASDFRDKEKASRMEKRFERECVKFLEYGLGLKNKCFPCEFQSLSES